MAVAARNAELVISRRRHIGTGVFFLLVALLILAFFVRTTAPDLTTTFGLNPARLTTALKLPDLVLPSLPSLWFLTAVCAFLGGWQLAKGFHSIGWALGVVAFAFVAAFLIWAARGKSMNLVGMLSSSILRSIPIALAAFCGILCERAAVINIAIEGMMLTGAFMAAWIGSITHSLWIGLLAAMLASGFLAAILAVLSIKFKVDQIVSGTVINIFATGLTSYLSAKFLQVYQNLNNPGIFKPISLPLLSRIPIIGPVFFEHNIIVYITFLLLILIHVMLFYTRWGLRTRAVGEHPKAADTLGVNVFRTRYINVIMGGLVAGIGGAFFTIGSVGRFDEVMTAGKGFIGLAAMIFGKWTPFGAFGSSIIFGFADSLQTKLQILQVPIPSEFLLMAPYLVTMVVLAGVIGRAVPPAADGQPYEKQ
ncbi:MAG: ABC transporter permease [Anaerolineae bacterium]